MIERFKRAWLAFKGEQVEDFKWNTQYKVFTDQSREWLDVDLAPRGVKLHLLTKEGMPTHGELNDRTLFQFKGWEPLPSTPQWMKEYR